MLGLLGLEEKWSKLPRLVKIRNPWGNSFEWRVSLESPPNMTNTCQGRWSDQHITENSKLSIEEKQSLVTGVGEWLTPEQMEWNNTDQKRKGRRGTRWRGKKGRRNGTGMED